MDNVRWGIIGCGDVTEVKSGPAFNKIEGSELVAVMRRDADKAADYARRHQVPKWYGDAGELIDDPQVNAVYIATPPGSHAEYVERVAAAGKPVYVEKPMARNYAECERMIEACEKAGVPLFVAYYRRQLPAFLKVVELLEAGAIGEVRYVSVNLLQAAGELDLKPGNWRVVPEESGAGYFFDLASHMLDFLDYALGPIGAVQGQAANQAGRYVTEDVVCANFTFASGVMGSGIWCFTTAASAAADRTEIVGSKGKIIYPTFGQESVRLETKSDVEEFVLRPPENIQQPLIETVVADLLGKGSCPSTGVSGARTSRVMDEIVSAYYAA
jgi:predicted dehydrogenase